MGSKSFRANALAIQAPSPTSALPQTTPTMIIQQPKGVTGHRSRQAPFVRLHPNTSKLADMEMREAKNARLIFLSHARLPIPTRPHFEKHTRPHFPLFLAHFSLPTTSDFPIGNYRKSLYTGTISHPASAAAGVSPYRLGCGQGSARGCLPSAQSWYSALGLPLYPGWEAILSAASLTPSLRGAREPAPVGFSGFRRAVQRDRIRHPAGNAGRRSQGVGAGRLLPGLDGLRLSAGRWRVHAGAGAAVGAGGGPAPYSPCSRRPSQFPFASRRWWTEGRRR